MKLSTFLILPIFMFSAGLISLLRTWSHMLSTLISLEFMTLSVFIGLSICPSSSSLELFNPILFLAIAVCEGAMGLSILILIVSREGNDLLSTSNSVTW